MPPTFGIVFNRDNTDPRPVVPSDLSVIGLVLPSDDADGSKFPLNTPVEFNSNDSVMLAAIGTGPLYKAITRINDNLGDLQVAARVVAVRVAEGEDDDETIVNIIGSQSSHTGLYALLTAGQLLGVIPRLIGAPGFTGQFTRTGGSTGVTSAAKTGGNTGAGALTLANPAYGGSVKAGKYLVRCIGGAKSASAAAKAGGNTGDGALGTLTADTDAVSGAWRVVCQAVSTDGGAFAVYRPDGTFDGIAVVGSAYNSPHGINFTISDGDADFIVGDEFVVTVADAVPADGGVFSVTDPDGNALANATVGVAYDTAHLKFTIADGNPDFAIGDGFDVTVAVTGGTAEANPICAALPAICAQLLAHAVVGGPGTTKQDALDWRETINSQRLIPVDNWEKVQRGESVSEEDGAATVLGLGVRVDFQNAGVPSHSWANQPVQGIIGLKRYDAFSLTAGATDAQELLAGNVGVTVRGELGVETAIASNGFVFVGTDNAGDDELWRFYNETRMDDYIHLNLLKSIRKRLGVTNITPHGIQAVLNDMTAFGMGLLGDEHVLSWKVGFEKDKNSPEDLRLGKFRTFYKSEIPAPLRRLDIDGRRDRDALTAMLETLIAQANTLVA
jgi:phage tail sheath protein FI